MSRIPKWKIEKTKIKVVFRLQFHATHIPQSGWDKLYISFIPADSGKATAKTTKANVRNGTCKWADPIYETTRLLQDIKTKQFDEKLYKLVVAMGSSRSSLLGEATINLADYAYASKPSVVPLPLIGCDPGAILHVTVQLLTSKTGFREFEQQRELREIGLQVGPDQNGPDQSSSGKVSVSEDILNIHTVKVNPRVRFKEKSKEHSLCEEDVGLNEDYGDSAVGFDGSSNTSESLCAEKHDTSSTHEIDSLKSTVSGDLTGLGHSPQQDKGDPSNHWFLAQGSNNWVHGWSSDYSRDNDLSVAYEENSRLRGCLEVAESSIQELKMEVSLLQNHVRQIGAETEKFSQQLVTEVSSGERLAKEISDLKLECSKLKDDLEQMTISKLCPSLTNKEAIKKGEDHLLQDLEVILSKGLLVMEDKIRELQDKVCLNYHERDHRFIQTDLEALLDILQDLKQGTQKEMFILRSVASERCNMNSTREMSLTNSFIPATSFDAELYQPEPGMVPCISVPGLMPHEPDSMVATNAMKGKIFELLRELDESKVERESLAKKMDQMECYYEALVQELEENQRQMLGELQSIRNEHSTCLFRVQSAKAEVETMNQDLNEQVLRFAEEKQDLESLSKELERRAIIAEAALKRGRLNYSIAVGQLQKDLELLSSQVMSVFETNESLIRQAFVDSSQTNSQGFSEEFQTTKPLHSKNQYVGVKKQQLGGDILLEDLKRSLHLQETLYQKVEEEVCEMHCQNVYLDVFSNTLLETLLEANDDIKTKKDKIDELAWQLELSLESKELLMQRLQTAMDDVHSLNEYKATCIVKYNDMALQKQALEENVKNITQGNHHLREKITELECCLMEYKSYKSEFNACVMEKTELANLLKEGTLENDNLRNNNSSLQEELRMIKAEFDELVLVKEKLQKTMDFLRNRVHNLMTSFGKFFEPPLSTDLVCQDIESEDLTSVIAQLEEVQNNAYENFLHLLKEKKDLMGERDKAQASLSVVESDMVLTKQKFECDVRAMVDKMDLSNAVVQKLQLEIEAVAEKLKVSSEVEETNAQQQRDLLSDLEHFETELQQFTSKNRDIAEELLVESVNEELGSNKLTVAELLEENKALVQSLRDKSEEASKLALEINGLQDSLHSAHDELQSERIAKDKLQSVITDLTSQMNENHGQLLQFDQHKSELGHLKHMLLDLESEKSRVCSLLQQSEERLIDAVKESSTITSLETQLSEMHERSIAADLILIFLRAQYENWTTDLVHQLFRSERQLAELQKKHHNFESILNGCLAREAHCIEESRRLSMTLDSLKSELEASMAENQILINKNSTVIAELQDCKSKIKKIEFAYFEDNHQHALEVERLKHLLGCSREEIDNLMVLKEELEFSVLVLKAKLDEQSTQMTTQMILLEGRNDEVLLLQNQCNELSQRLSEQILKTEEFKNLSIHLKELKDKADAESIQAPEKRESEAPPTAMQESLRIAFIKEQYETRLQELKHQLAVSKKHSEEMLWKLQDAVDDIENRKKSEASHLKRNEELGVKILELEAELQALISEKREKMRAYDLMKTEMDCSMITLEFCMEEKQKLEAYLQECNEEKQKLEASLQECNAEKQKLEASLLECNEEKSRLSVELRVVKELLETSKSTTNFLTERNGKLKDASIPGELVVNTAPTRDIDFMNLDQDTSENSRQAEGLVPVGVGDRTNASTDLRPEQDLVANDTNEVQSLTLVNQWNLPKKLTSPLSSTPTPRKESDQLSQPTIQLGRGAGPEGFEKDPSSNPFELQRTPPIPPLIQSLSIAPSMFSLKKPERGGDQEGDELERMKNENLILSKHAQDFNTKFPCLQQELMQLDKVNEELGSIFPSFNEYLETGNALERVLALELELAEALQTKKKSSILFQSSFLKQHNDEEAVFKSFRDINELIKDMLEIKGKYGVVETELKEMHERYSQLSLQFAEVEGERQKLVMTLKNIRQSRKAQNLIRSSSASPGDHS
ncbi:LOW QUALITY PROTEIN: GRIP and coiled-coil domain-containing protein 2-like [Hibiscus syriacus]|uniref:LOW QUALITY PROTEIN: GRIP and coiled-coil domain-containing protein 2-like n=1 Tax=Hibiscus syriacus TaxID=106335 RepID=UPI001924A631|nr:LOW QUALITY PROTEIN: GRIP and coiled-coil domain-containing protein 2-like [Hibiscus syriacus]